MNRLLFSSPGRGWLHASPFLLSRPPSGRRSRGSNSTSMLGTRQSSDHASCSRSEPKASAVSRHRLTVIVGSLPSWGCYGRNDRPREIETRPWHLGPYLPSFEEVARSIRASSYSKEHKLGEMQLALLSVVVTLGTPGRLLVVEMRIELFHPAIAETRILFRALSSFIRDKVSPSTTNAVR